MACTYPSIHKNSQDHGRLSGVWCGVCVWCVVFCVGVGVWSLWCCVLCGWCLCVVVFWCLVFGRGGVVCVVCCVCVCVSLCVCVNKAVNKVSTKSAFEDV